MLEEPLPYTPLCNSTANVTWKHLPSAAGDTEGESVKLNQIQPVKAGITAKKTNSRKGTSCPGNRGAVVTGVQVAAQG